MYGYACFVKRKICNAILCYKHYTYSAYRKQKLKKNMGCHQLLYLYVIFVFVDVVAVAVAVAVELSSSIWMTEQTCSLSYKSIMMSIEMIAAVIVTYNVM